LAETGGFEPPIRCDPYNGLANRRLQPLGHVSTLGNPYRLSVFASMRATQGAHIARTTSICGGTQGGTARLVICDARQRLPAQGALLRCAGTSKQCQPPGHKTGNMQFIAASRDCGFSWAQGGLHGQRAVRCRCNHSRARPGPQLPPHLKKPTEKRRDWLRENYSKNEDGYPGNNIYQNGEESFTSGRAAKRVFQQIRKSSSLVLRDLR
jgi:hypothetical protein